MSLIIRSAARLSNKILINRQFSLFALPRLINAGQQQQQSFLAKNLNLILNNKKNISTSSIRFYSDQQKLDKSQIEGKVLEILRNFDRVKENPAKPQVSLESHLMKDLGLDSLDQVEIIVQLEDTFGYEIPDSDYEKLNTATEIVNYIQKRLAEI